MEYLPKRCHKCCNQPREKEEFNLTSTRHYKERLVKIYHCQNPKCQSMKLVTVYTDRLDHQDVKIIEKTKDVKKELEILIKESITIKRYRSFKPDPAPGLAYLKGEDGTIRKLNDVIIEHFESEIEIKSA